MSGNTSNHYEDAINTLDNGKSKWVPGKAIDGKALVRTSGTPNSLETRTVTFDLAAEMPADITSNANVLALLVKLNDFQTGKKRARVTFHGAETFFDATNDSGPVCTGAFVTLNCGAGAGDSIIAADRLTLVDVTGSDTGALDTKKRIVSKSSPVIEWNLEGTDSTIDNIFISGIPNLVTVAGVIIPVFLEVEVW